ncbi:MAG: hypothetical protein K0S56_4177, partial [Microvirga sp.]|nr:hypothetical protein [Microvirga sp.]
AHDGEQKAQTCNCAHTHTGVVPILSKDNEAMPRSGYG